MIVAVAEQRGGILNPASWEAVAAAQQLSEGDPITIVVPGADPGAVAAELAAADVREVVALEAPQLDPYTPDGYTLALQQAIDELAPTHVVLTHTYQTRDFAPKLAERLDRALVTDVVRFERRGAELRFVRWMFQGKVVAEVALQGPPPHFVSVQVAAFKAEGVRRGAGKARVRALRAQIGDGAVRERPEPPFREARRSVDLSQAERIVSVGRGIKGPEHLPLARQLATALGAELAASRPVCDAGWMPVDCQIGSSGQTVSPRLYFAVGISGAMQHLVGMKDAHVIAAVNDDPQAPIFDIARYGIVGDLFEIVPALIAALEADPSGRTSVIR
jgi:electron transfer flavoprotein alpha subunit